MPIEIIMAVLQLLNSVDAFLSNKAVQEMLNDEELIDKALDQLNMNQIESDRIKAKLMARMKTESILPM